LLSNLSNVFLTFSIFLFTIATILKLKFNEIIIYYTLCFQTKKK